MPEIANELERSQKVLAGAFGAEAFGRDDAIGYGHNGCYPQWSDLLWLLGQLVGDLGWEVRNGAKTLELAIEDMGRTDTEASDALGRHAKSLEGGSSYHPRDPEEVRDEARNYGLI